MRVDALSDLRANKKRAEAMGEQYVCGIIPFHGFGLIKK